MVTASLAPTAAPTWNRGPTRDAYRLGPSEAEWVAGAVLARGDSGSGVLALQAQLNALGAEPPLVEDGLFGPKTEATLLALRGRATIDGASFLALSAGAATPDAIGPGRANPEVPPLAPHLEAKAPAGTVKAGALQEADAERRRSHGSGMKSGAPPGYAPITGRVPPGVVAEAKGLLHHDYGAEIPFELDGQRYLARLERHYHPPGYQGGPNGWHKGVTVYRAT